MGLLEALLGKDNPAAMWANDNSNLLGALGAGLAGGQNIQDGFAQGLAYAPQAKALDRQAVEKRKADALIAEQANQTSEWLKANYPQYAHLPPEQGFRLAMEAESQKYSGANGPTADIQNYEYSLTHPGFTDFQTQKGGPAEMSLQPTWMRDGSGQWFVGAQTKDGRVVKLDTPEGMSVVPPADVAGAKAGATVDAKTAAEARAALPGLEQSVDIANKALDLVTTDDKGLNEQFGTIMGVPQRNLPVYPGSSLGNWQANFQQAKGQAFMQAREALKGGGQVTDFEGAKAESAYSRMEAAAATGDKGAFLAAAQDFRDAVSQGLSKLRAVANGGYSAGAPAVSGGDDIDAILTGLGI